MIKTLIGLVSITLGLLALAVAARLAVEIWREKRMSGDRIDLLKKINALEEEKEEDDDEA